MMPKEGDKAPKFSLKDTDGKTIKLSDYKNRKVVLYFYPRDMTPGCTTEAYGFQSALPKFTRQGTFIIGVSTDDQEAHRKFREKYKLGFTLLCDTAHILAEKYGVWKEKDMYGKKVWGVTRTTFIIDGEGRIAKVFEKVRPETHSEEVLNVLKTLK